MNSNVKKYFLVGRDGLWTKDSQPLSFFTNKGASVRQSRANGENDFDLWINGFKMGTLFENQADQISYLRQIGSL